MTEKRITIKGAGLQGLTAAYYLREYKPLVYEAKQQIGGWIQSCTVDNFLFELGPRGFRPKGDGLFTLKLIQELGLEKELIAPPKAAAIRYIYTKGSLHPLPYSFKSLFSFMGRSLLKGIFRDLLMPRKNDLHTINDYFSYRFGKTFTKRVVDPGVRGIFGGNIKELSFKQCFPEIYQEASNHRSLTLALLTKKAGEKDPIWSKYPILSFKKGMSTLIHALAEYAEIKTASRIEEADIDSVQKHPSASMAVVNIGYRKKVLPVSGFGYLVPSSENEPIMGCVFDSEIFPQQNNHPEETRLTVMLGGVEQPEMLDHPDLIGLVQKTLYRHMGIKKDPDAASITLCRDAIPQYRVGDTMQGVGVNSACRKGYEKGISYAHATHRVNS